MDYEREDLLSRLSEEDLKDEKKACIAFQDLDGLLALAIFRFKRGTMATHQFEMAEMAYFLGRKHDVKTFNELVGKYIGPLIYSYPEESITLSKVLFTVGEMFPDIPDEYLKALKDLYLMLPNHRKLIETIFFDKDKMTKPVDFLRDYPDSFLDRIVKCFSINAETIEFGFSDKLAYYNDLENRIVYKTKEEKLIYEFLIQYQINGCVFFGLIAQKYGPEVVDYFADRLNPDPFGLSNEDFIKSKKYSFDVFEDILQIANGAFEDTNELDDFKRLMALQFIEGCTL